MKCECGCGGEIVIKPFHKYYGIPKYIRGHYYKTEEHRKELSKQLKGKPSPKKGIELSKEHIKKISNSMCGENNPMYGVPSPMTGKKHSEKTLRKMSEWQIGENNSNWKGGISPIRKRIWRSIEYKTWRKKVFERDLYACRNCGNIHCVLNAHHIKPIHQILKENNITTFEAAINCRPLWDLDNGITYCEKCHKKINTRRYV